MDRKTAESIGRTGFAGAGRVGMSFGKYLSDHGVSISGYVSRTRDSADKAAEFTHSRSYDDVYQLMDDSDTLFLTVPDGQISEVWDHMRGHSNSKDKLYVHCSGAMDSSVFSRDGLFHGLSVHPLMAVSDCFTSYRSFPVTVFTIEGTDDDSVQRMKNVLTACGNSVAVIDSSVKPLYHAAAATASNLVAALFYTAQHMLMDCGFEKDQAAGALRPIFLANAESVAARGPVQALTGPVERNDAGTVKKHLEAFAGMKDGGSYLNYDDISEAYRSLSRILLRAAAERHPERDQQELEKILQEDQKNG